jgi:Rrf2 family protein
MLSHTCKTALKAVTYLAAQHREGRKCSISEIAEYIEASAHTVGKFLQTLVREDIICSTKGPSGGFYVTTRQLRQPAIRIIEAIEGNEIFTACGMGLKKCSSLHPCPIHDAYKSIRETFESLCRTNTLADLCAPLNTGSAHLTLRKKHRKH